MVSGLSSFLPFVEKMERYAGLHHFLVRRAGYGSRQNILGDLKQTKGKD